MYCLLCDFNSKNDEAIETWEALQKLRLHNIFCHLINENNYHFKELFTPSNVSKRCDSCKIEFEDCMVKKNHNFIYHYYQVGESGTNSQLPMIVLQWGTIKQYTKNLDQHKTFYDLFDESIVDEFIKSVYERFSPDDDQYKIMGYDEIIINLTK